MNSCFVTISVVTYNSEKHISALLDSITTQIKGVDFHVYIIDNASADITVQIVRDYCESDERITLIESRGNIGFGRAHNLVLERIDSHYHVIINPDITLKSDVITELCCYLDKREDIGLVTPKVLFPSGGLQILPKRDPRFIYLMSRRLNFKFLKKYRQQYEMSDRDMESPFDVDFCTGAFMFMRTSVYKQVGGFDERYFLYFEDADITRKIRQLTRTEYNPNFVVYHHWERFGKTQMKYMAIQMSSMVKYFVKWNNYQRQVIKKKKDH